MSHPPPPAYSPGGAFGYGWRKLQQNLGPILLATLAIVLVVVLVQGLGLAVAGAVSAAGRSKVGYDSNGTYTYGGSSSVRGLLALLVSLGFALLATVLGFVAQAVVIRGALDITDGHRVTVRSMVRGLDLGQVVLASVLLATATTAGLVLCLLPGFVVVFFTGYTLFFVVDRQLPALEAIRASVTMVNRDPGTLVGFFLGAVLACLVGALLCLVGLLVAVPLVVIAQAYTYRTLRGEVVAT